MKALDNLFLRVKTYISNHRELDGGGWAEIVDEDIDDLYSIIYKIIELKCEADADGDRPIEVILVDRRTRRQLYPVDIPYDVNKEAPLERGGKIDLMLTKLRGLADELEKDMRLIQLEERFKKEKKEKEKKENHD